MGAIAAFLSSTAPPDTEILERMLDAAPHRGSERVVRSHGRCAIGVSFSDGLVDATIATRDGVTAAVCGRVDNLRELGSSLSGPGDHSPADAVLAAFRAFGDAAPSRLRGVFAGVVTDGSSITAFRDHFGLEPLFYRDQGPAVYVATEPKQIIAGSGIAREPDRDVVYEVLFRHYPHETSSALRGVRRVPQGSVVTAGANGVRWRRYWEPAHLLETADLRPDEVKERFDRLMGQAAARVLTEDAVLTLSGGIDSPAVAAYAAPEMRQRTGRSLAALSSVYPKFPRVDERPYIDLVARELGLELHVYEPQATPFAGLRALISLCDGPAPGTALAQAREEHATVRALGFRTIVTGEFAEYLIDAGQAHLVGHLLRNRRVSALRALFRSQRARGAGLADIGRQLARSALPAGLVGAYARQRDEPYRPDWLDRSKFDARGQRPPPPGLRWRQSQLGMTESPSWSFDADAINQAASGVRVRRPWLDIDLWEFFLSLRAETKYPDVQPKKLLVRRLLRGRVPDPILDRARKTYFDDWLLATIEYPFIRELLIDPEERVPGVDYARLAERLRHEDLTVQDFIYIRTLAGIHAFLES